MAIVKRRGPKKAVSRKKSGGRSGAAKKPAKKAKKKRVSAASRARRIVKKTQDRLRSVTAENTGKRAAKLAVNLIELQKTTFDNTIDAAGKLQEQTGKGLHRLLKDASWMPGEGKEVVDEWIKATKKSRTDFKKSMDKSFDLITKYFDRVQRQSAKGKAKKKAVKRKKAGPKKAAAKRSAKKSA